MKLSENTITLLQNFATIQPNILMGKEPNKLKTVSEARNIFCIADIAEVFADEVGVYDLTELLSAISLIKDPEFTINGNVISIDSADSKAGIKYACANTSILTVPSQDITDPEYEISLPLSEVNLVAIKRAASILCHDTFSIIKTPDSESIVVKVHDLGNKSSNSWTSTVGKALGDCSFNFHFKISNLKILPGNYKLSLSSKLISRWVCEQMPVSYWIAIEHTSKYVG